MATRRAALAVVPGIVVALVAAGRADEPAKRQCPKLEASKIGYVGAGACASQNCHGSALPRGESETSLQNEFLIWYHRDRHAHAYTVLEGERGRRILAKMHMPAEPPPRCLSCHTTYEPESPPSSARRLADGVTCESCHGPAGAWIDRHTEPGWDPACGIPFRKIDTTQPQIAAETCLGCHLGDGDTRRVDHELLAAGHPPLSFELDSFAVDMPAHWTHRTTKDGKPPLRNDAWFDGRAWAAGQVVAARMAAELFGKQVRAEGWPDFAAYECQACHHEITRGTWSSRGAGDGRPPLDPARRPGMNALVEVVDGRRNASATNTLARTGASGRPGRAVDDAIRGVVDESQHVSGALHDPDRRETRIVALMKTITDLHDETARLGFRAAQQAVWALDSLVDARAALHRSFDGTMYGELRRPIRRVYAGLTDPNRYDPARTSDDLAAVGAALK